MKKTLKFQVIWKAHTGRHGSLVGGVCEFDTFEEIKEWNEQESVRFGEDGGAFFLEGCWLGAYQDLQDGSSIFHNKEALTRFKRADTKLKHIRKKIKYYQIKSKLDSLPHLSEQKSTEDDGDINQNAI